MRFIPDTTDLQQAKSYVCAHKKTRFKSQILENELNADYETTAISGQTAI